MIFRSSLKFTLFAAIVSTMLLGSRSGYSQTVTANNLGAANLNIYKTNKQRVYGFAISSTGGDATITGLTTQATGGNYIAADFLSFELYYNDIDNFNTATLIGTSGPPAGFGESLNFGSFAQTIVGDGANRFLYIAGNVTAGANTGHTFSIPFLDATNFTFSTLVAFNPTLGSSGTKTIQDVPTPFITTWKTDNPGPSNDDQITIYTTGSGYFYDVNWGDGMFDTEVTGNIIHTYATPGTYTVSITGNFPRIYFNDPSFFSNRDSRKILTVEQWGNNPWTSMASAFTGCINLRINAPDAPNLLGVTNMSRMFMKAAAMNDNINSWNVGTVTNMIELFSDATAFNQPLNNWNVGSVTDMSQMFWFASAFNQNIGGWTVDNVTNMGAMFAGAPAFNQNIGGWNVLQVTTMAQMFSNATAFNQDISGWTVNNVTDMGGLFSQASAFNQNISGWNIDNVTNMANMFRGAIAFTNDITGWNVINVTQMNGMFSDHPTFNQNISGWTVDNVNDMSSMFDNTPMFNQDISGWNVTKVRKFNSMFDGATSFNQPIGSWTLNTVATIDMRGMFDGATTFDQDLSGWDVRQLSQAFNMLNNSGLSVTNYDNLLEGWSSLSPLKTNVQLGAAGLYYCIGATARGILTGTYNWNITDEGQGCLQAFYGVDTAAPEIFNGQVSAVDLGSIDILPSTKVRSITILNGQDVPVTNVIVSITGTTFAATSAPVTVLAGATYTFTVTFSNAIANTYNETLSITSDNFPGAFSFPLTGKVTAAPEPEIVVYSGPTATGNQINDGDSFGFDVGEEFRGNNVTNQVTIFNNGAADLNISGINITGTTFSLLSPPPTLVSPDNSVTIDIILDGSIAGSFFETLTITSDDTDEGDFDFGITGLIYGPEISVFDGLDRYSDPEVFNGQLTAINLGSGAQGADITRTLTIANFGRVDMIVSNISITGTAFSTTFSPPQFVGAENDGVVSSITFGLILSGATGGSFNETVTIFSDDDTDPLFVFPVTGTITGGACGVTPTVNAGADSSTCPATPFQLSGTIGGSATAATWSSSGTGTFDNNAILNATYTASAADETSGSVILTLTVAANGSCPQVTDQLTLAATQPIVASTPSVQSNIGAATTVDIVGTSTINIGDVITTTILTNPTKGSVVITSNGNVDYTPASGTIGADSFEYRICNQCNLCSDGSANIDILNQAPVFTAPATPPSVVPGSVITILITDYLTDLNNNIDLASLINLTTTGNAVVSYDGNGIITMDYSNATFSSNNESVSFRIFDTSLAFVDVTISINVIGDIFVRNGISPNSDGLNDYFKIENIEFLEPENQVLIYNRWGDKVYSADNYNNDSKRFTGVSNDGKELPSGVYFYKIKFIGIRSEMSGYLTLKK